MNSRNIWMDPLYLEDHLNEQEKLIKISARNFCNSALLPYVVENNRNHFFDDKLFKEFGSMGFLGSSIDGYGGANASKVSYGIIASEFESVDSSYRSAISVQSSLVIHPIFSFGSNEQKEEYLSDLIKGNKIGCFALTESEAGSDPRSMKTYFKETSDCFILNGSKNFTSYTMDLTKKYIEINADYRS